MGYNLRYVDNITEWIVRGMGYNLRYVDNIIEWMGRIMNYNLRGLFCVKLIAG